MSAPVRIVLAFTLLVPGQGAEEGVEARIATAMGPALAAMDLTDGVDAGEARTLAAAYFVAAISGCGGVGDVRPGADGWIAETRIGIAGAPGPEVIVARDGGSVRADGHPTVRLARGAVVEAATPTR